MHGNCSCVRIWFTRRIVNAIHHFFNNKPTRNYKEGLDGCRQKVWEALPASCFYVFFFCICSDVREYASPSPDTPTVPWVQVFVEDDRALAAHLERVDGADVRMRTLHMRGSLVDVVQD